MSRQVWERIDYLVDRSPSLDDLAAHGLHLLAAERWRAQGHVVPNGLVREELLAEYAVRSLPQLVEEVRDATTGPLVVFKGPTLAALYERPTLRPFSDLDVLVRDPAVTQAALVASDFVPTDDPAAYEHVSHQLVPLLRRVTRSRWRCTGIRSGRVRSEGPRSTNSFDIRSRPTWRSKRS